MFYYKYYAKANMFQEHREGYIDTFTVITRNFYRVKTIKIFKWYIPYSKELLFSEDIPEQVIFDRQLLGFTEWKTKCPEDIFLKCRDDVTKPII